MMESDGEIEYLDEDAEIVQQCVQTTTQIPNETKISPEPRQLLVERVPKKKKVRYDDESDYDPEDDLKITRKRKAPQSKVVIKAVKTVQPQIKTVQQLKSEMDKRRKMDIMLPDYEDPLCLPVKLARRNDNDLKRLRKWNNLCLEHLKTGDECLKPKSGKAVSSQRTVVLRNVKHNVTGDVEVTVWSKSTVQNAEGDKKSEVFQCVLPKYREKCVLEYNLTPIKRKKVSRSVNMMLITKEDTKEGESLVIYSPNDAVAATYKLIDEPEPDLSEEDENKPQMPLNRRYLQEASCCKVCAPCYQSSWRPTRVKGDDNNISCVICGRAFISVYNLLTHVRTHSNIDVRRHKGKISKALSQVSTVMAEVVDYHYKCRICQDKFNGIKDLRKHVTTHINKEKFFCEVGNHFTQ